MLWEGNQRWLSASTSALGQIFCILPRLCCIFRSRISILDFLSINRSPAVSSAKTAAVLQRDGNGSRRLKAAALSGTQLYRRCIFIKHKARVTLSEEERQGDSVGDGHRDGRLKALVSSVVLTYTASWLQRSLFVPVGQRSICSAQGKYVMFNLLPVARLWQTGD